MFRYKHLSQNFNLILKGASCSPFFKEFIKRTLHPQCALIQLLMSKSRSHFFIFLMHIIPTPTSYVLISFSTFLIHSKYIPNLMASTTFHVCHVSQSHQGKDIINSHDWIILRVYNLVPVVLSCLLVSFPKIKPGILLNNNNNYYYMTSKCKCLDHI